jgi:preprotein translocase subunit YajC
MEWIFLVVIAGMFVLASMSNRKRRRLALEMTEKLQPGASVVLLGGIKGKIVSIGDDSIVFESTPGTKIDVLKSAIRTVEQAEAKPVDKTPAAKKPTTTKADAAKPVAKKPAAKKPAATKTASK